jgi:quercetin dioxygenase-like cupin family protein
MYGDGEIERVQYTPASAKPRTVYVKFVNGACTKWHYHTGEQLLVATEGTGFVEFRSLPAITLQKGDRLFILAVVWHRHDAAEGETIASPGGCHRRNQLGISEALVISKAKSGERQHE